MSPSNAQDALHPSPHRARVGLPRLLYGLVAAPTAWALSQLANSALAQGACFPGTEPLASPAFPGLQALLAAPLLMALLVSASAAWVAGRAWRSTRAEQAGDQHTLLAVGEGRSRFMALAGVLTGLGFLTATLFSLPAIFLVPGC